MNRYPDMGNSALYAALADRLGVPQERLAAGTGSVAVLYHLLQAFCDPGDEVVYAWRSFEAYPIAVSGDRRESRCRSRSTPRAVTTSTRWPPRSPSAPRSSSSAPRTTRPGPRSPTPSCARSSPRSPTHVLVVVDEAYREFVREDDPVDAPAPSQAEHANVAVMRTFAKAYGLAGFRVGYVVAHEEVAAAVRACCAALRGLQRRPGRRGGQPCAPRRSSSSGSRRSSPSATGWSPRLEGQGWTFPEPQGNFVWLPLGERTPDLVAAGRGGRHHRPALRRRGRAGQIGEPAANDLFLGVAEKLGPA